MEKTEGLSGGRSAHEDSGVLPRGASGNEEGNGRPAEGLSMGAPPLRTVRGSLVGAPHVWTGTHNGDRSVTLTSQDVVLEETAGWGS